MTQFADRVMALAAICQAVKLVEQSAREGSCKREDVETLLRGIMVTNPQGAHEVYGGTDALRLGYQVLMEQLENLNNSRSPTLTGYLINILVLERKLASRRDHLTLLGDRINQVQRQLQHFAITSPTVIGALADTYVDAISPLGARVQVTGSPTQLQRKEIQQQVRALLLAAIRAAVLWRQLGGKRRQFIFSRGAIAKEARRVLGA